MADYQDIRGLRVKYLSADPSNPETGEVWYNSTSGTLKTYILAPGTVASSGGVNTGATQLGSCGITSAGLKFGGESPSLTGITEEFDGSSWTNGGTCPAAKSDMHGSGTQTAALWGGGSPSSSGSFEYNGASWTAGGAMTFAGRDFTGGGVGLQTAALQIGGFISPGNLSDVMQEYNGTSWSNIPQTFPTAADTGGFGSCGTQTAALSSGGSGNNTNNLSWNGASWTTENSLNIGVSAQVQTGTSTLAVCVSGHPANPPSYSNEIQTWDGTNWSTSPATLGSGRAQAAGGGTTTSAWVAAGAPGPLTSTEIYSGPALATRTLTTS